MSWSDIFGEAAMMMMMDGEDGMRQFQRLEEGEVLGGSPRLHGRVFTA